MIEQVPMDPKSVTQKFEATLHTNEIYSVTYDTVMRLVSRIKFLSMDKEFIVNRFQPTNIDMTGSLKRIVHKQVFTPILIHPNSKVKKPVYKLFVPEIENKDFMDYSMTQLIGLSLLHGQSETLFTPDSYSVELMQAANLFAREIYGNPNRETLRIGIEELCRKNQELAELIPIYEYDREKFLIEVEHMARIDVWH